MKAIIIDDEAPSRDLLISHLSNHCAAVEIIGVAHNGMDGLTLIAQKKPDLVFLDVEMPNMSGFELLQELGKTPDFEVIFCTAHEGYAARAFRFSATDFLQKPVKIIELQNAVIKAQEQRLRRTESDRAQQIKLLMETIQKLSPTAKTQEMPSRIAIQGVSEITFIEISQILWIEADGNYSKVATKNGAKILVSSKPLAHFEDTLREGFFRSHRSFLINLKEIHKILKGDDQVEMSDQKRISISKGRREELMRQLRIDA